MKIYAFEILNQNEQSISDLYFVHCKTMTISESTNGHHIYILLHKNTSYLQLNFWTQKDDSEIVQLK